MVTITKLRSELQGEQDLRLKLDALVCEAHACLDAAREHLRHGREAEAWLLLDATHRILATHATA